MFNIGEKVMYGRLGIYRIDDIKAEDFSGEMRSYYVLTPLNEKNGVSYIPLDIAETKLKKALDEKKIKKVLSEAKKEEEQWITDGKLRREKASDILKSGDHVCLIRLIRLYYSKKEELEKKHRKFFAADAKALTEAEALILQEFSTALNISCDDVRQLILKK